MLATRKASCLMTPEQSNVSWTLLEETDRLNAAGRVLEVMAKFTESNNFIYELCVMCWLKMIVYQR